MLSLFLLLLLLWILAGLAVFLWGTRTPRPGTSRLVRTSDRRLGYVHSPVTVRLWPSGHDLPVEERRREPRRVALVVDHSAEMGRGPGSPLEQAVNVAVSFAENFVAETCHVGVVTVDRHARTLRPADHSKANVVEALRSITPGSGLDLGRGLSQAQRALEESPAGASSSSRNFVVLLSNGGGDTQAALEAAGGLKEQGVRVITVAFGPYADEDLLRRVASCDDDFLRAREPGGLARLYESVGDPPAASRGHRAFVGESVNTEHFLISATGHVPLFELNFNKGEVTWFVPFVTAPAGAIAYDVLPTKAGWHRVARRPATVEMLDKDGTIFRGDSNASPRLLVLPRGWWPGLALLFNPPFWIIWSRLFGRAESSELSPAPARAELALPDAEPVRPALGPGAPPSLKPALVIGVGYAGSLILRALRYQLGQLIPRPAGTLRFLWIDTGPDSDDDLKASGPFGEPIPEEDRVLMPESVQPVFQGLRGTASPPEHLAWLDVERTRSSLVARDYDLSRGTLRRRVLGRVAFYRHLEAGPDAPLRKALDERLTTLGRHYRVFVVGHMGGGTCGGMMLDLLVFLRKRIRQLKQEVVSVDGLLLTHHALDDGALDPALSRNTVAFATELSRVSIRRHLPLRVAQTPHEDGSPVEVQDLLDKLLVLEHPLEPPSDRTQWPGPVTHSAAELLLHLLLDEGQGAAAFLDGQLADWRAFERASGHSAMCAAGVTSRWLPLCEARQLLTARTVLDFLSRDLLQLARAGERLTPAHDPEGATRAREDVAALLEGAGLRRPLPALIGSLASLAEPGTAGSELSRVVAGTDAYPGSKGGIPPEVGGSRLIAVVLDAQQELFAAALEEWSLRLLHGEPRADGTFDPAVRRGAFPRLAAAVEHLDALSDACLKYLDAHRGQSAAANEDPRRVEFVRYLFARYRAVTAGYRRHLTNWAGSLLTLAEDVDRAASSAAQRLQTVAEELRPYVLWSDEMRDRLTARYCGPARERLLEQVLWTTEPSADGSVRLSLRVCGREDARFRGGLDEVASVRRALEAIVPDIELSCGLDLYREDVGQYVDLKRWVTAERADPVRIDPNVQSALAGRPFARKEFARLAEEAQVGSSPLTEVVRADYPYRASVVRLLTGCALFAASALQDDRHGAPGEPHAALPFLDPVDRLAAAHEDRFSDFGLAAPTLCPAIRAYFRDRELLRAFVLAHALRLLRQRVAGEREALFLNGVQLTTERRESGYPALLEALDNFVILTRSAGGDDIDRVAVLREVENSVAERDAEDVRQLVRGLSESAPAYLEACPPAVRNDFLALAELFLNLELRRREEARREVV